MIDLACLASFVAVVETASFNAAAARQGLSQSGVSQHVARLEAVLGASLLVRNRRASVPSEAGFRLLPYARELLALERRARAAVQASRLTIGASGNIAVYLLPDLVRRFEASEAGRGVEVAITVDTNPEVLRRLDRRLLDVALTEWLGTDADVSGAVWRREPMVAIVPPGHALARGRSVQLERLAREPMIGGEPGSGTATLLREAFGEAVEGLVVRLTFGSTEGVKRAVMAGLGVSIVMRAAVEDELRSGQLVALSLAGRALTKSLYAVRRTDDAPGSPAARFSAFIAQGRSRSRGASAH